MYRFSDARTEIMTGIFTGVLTVEYQHYRQSVGYNVLCEAANATEAAAEQLPDYKFAQRIPAFYHKLAQSFFGSFTTRDMTLFAYTPSDPEFVPEQKGGLVTCHLLTKDGTIMSYGESVCLPEDNFHESAGRDLAFNYAVFDATKRLFRTKTELCGNGRTETEA